MNKKGHNRLVNRKALHDFSVLESIEVGMVLTGPEVKSLRLGQASMRESYVLVSGQGAAIHNMMITPYRYARIEETESHRPIPLLLKKREIERLRGLVQQKGVSLVPLKIYLKHGIFKAELGVVRGKKQYEKREMIKRRDIDREIAHTIKDWKRGS